MIIIPTRSIKTTGLCRCAAINPGEHERIDKSSRERAQCVEQGPVACEPEH